MEPTALTKPLLGLIHKAVSALDIDKSNALDMALEEYLLEEPVRLRRLIDERAADIVSGGCSPEEALILVYQGIDAQRRTADRKKRRLLTNALVNGLCASGVGLARRRLMLRWASELEVEHIEILRAKATFKSRAQADLESPWRDLPEKERRRREDEWEQTQKPLTDELAARGLLTPRVDAPSGALLPEHMRRGLQPSVRLEISTFGREFLAFLRSPETEEHHALAPDMA